MSSPRKHPSLYPYRLSDLLSGPTITLTLPSHLAAQNLRYQLYSFRESLRNHPDHNVALLLHANSATLRVEENKLHIVKPQLQNIKETLS